MANSNKDRWQSIQCGPAYHPFLHSYIHLPSSLHITSSHPVIRSILLPLPPLLALTHGSRVTCHIRRAVLIRRAPDAQLAVAVRAPTLDPAPGHDRARVDVPRGDGNGGDA